MNYGEFADDAVAYFGANVRRRKRPGEPCFCSVYVRPLDSLSATSGGATFARSAWPLDNPQARVIGSGVCVCVCVCM